MSSVVRTWVAELTWKQQSVLFCAMRGVDGFPKEHVSKPLTRMYRRTILKCADLGSKTGFMSGELLNQGVVDKFLAYELDSYPMHWLMHFMHAVEIIGYKHSDKHTRIFWNKLYKAIVFAMHLRPEYESEMDFRLIDGKREHYEI